MPEEPVSRRMTLLYSCCAGGGQKLCPEAQLDDGLLDVTFVQNVPPRRVPELMQVVLAGKRQDDLQECVKTFKTPWFEVRQQLFLCCVADLHCQAASSPASLKASMFQSLPAGLCGASAHLTGGEVHCQSQDSE